MNKLKNFFNKPEINTERQFEFDFLKAICILGMIIVHVFEEFSKISEEIEIINGININNFFVVVLNGLFGAQSFMFAMGHGIGYNKKNTPELLIKRGLKLFILAYVLNFSRNFLPFFTLLFSKPTEKPLHYFFSVAEIDIMHFAGLALFFYGLFKKYKIPTKTILIISIIMSLFGSIFSGTYTTGSWYLNVLSGLFIGTIPYNGNESSNYIGEIVTCFPLFNWFIFVILGILFTYILKRIKDKDKFYNRIIYISLLIVITYTFFALPKKIGIFSDNQVGYAYIKTFEVPISVCASFILLFLGNSFNKILPNFIKTTITKYSKNINTLYWISWIIINNLKFIIKNYFLNNGEILSKQAVIIISICVIIATNLICKIIKKDLPINNYKNLSNLH